MISKNQEDFRKDLQELHVYYGKPRGHTPGHKARKEGSGGGGGSIMELNNLIPKTTEQYYVDSSNLTALKNKINEYSS